MGTQGTTGIQEFANKLTDVIINPIIALIFAGAFLVFVWGIVEFMMGLASDSESKNTGKQHMLWGMVGMFIMVAAYAILHIVANSVCGSLEACQSSFYR